MTKIFRAVFLGIIIMVVGLIMCGIGSINGGENRIVWQSGHFVIPQNETLNKHVQAFKNIKIEGDTLQVTLIRDNQLTSGYSIIGQVSNSDGLKIKQVGNQLTIAYHDVHSHVPNFTKANQEMDRIAIKVPAKATMSQVMVNVDSGDITLKRFAGQRMNISTRYGRVTTHQVTATQLKVTNREGVIVDDQSQSEQLNLSTQYGAIYVNQSKTATARLHASMADITATNTNLGKPVISVDNGNTTLRNVKANNVLAQTGTGDYTLESSTLLGSNVFFTKNGNVETTGLNEEGYRLQIQNSGQIKFKGQTMQQSYDNQVNAENRIMFATYDGNITVN
ncbi:DUF4097 family beta strand repeat protein [Weissella diestrammenae]|uniref:DUF4097 family beta strand repeat protein n=1 Tax=Weissella diestrammenae TaxID=1162633 RepID=A0A7G9T7A7_9LACO|nr:DUF4097 family beta strand repeat-containing protein [Weissella diestrammenae]MCM0581992.1 DUF4097 family beta strand repeat protein [Weissella diestrammenae]QNN75982.1 DUF4097 family beta strand repeat protein [Weissella diestrammenae]